MLTGFTFLNWTLVVDLVVELAVDFCKRLSNLTGRLILGALLVQTIYDK